MCGRNKKPASSNNLQAPPPYKQKKHQVLRIQIQASGAVGSRLAAREAVVERMLRRESAGVYVLLFNSVGTGDEDALAGQGGGVWGPPLYTRHRLKF
jgi:hypothetical protein